MDGFTLNGRWVLVVEAEPIAALEAETSLRDAGAKVYAAHKLRDALYMAEHPALSAVVIAQRLGGDNTAAVCRRLADLGVPFVLHTRYDATEARQKWPDAPVVPKHASTNELVRAVVGLMP
jgi:CheY-like chemotaxis protein